MGGTPKWMAFNGRSQQNGRFGGTPILGNHLKYVGPLVFMDPSPNRSGAEGLQSETSESHELGKPGEAASDFWGTRCLAN